MTQKTPDEVSAVACLPADQRTRRLTPEEIEGLRQRGHEQSALIRAALDRHAQDEAKRRAAQIDGGAEMPTRCDLLDYSRPTLGE